jgi:hypothetical protein
MFSPEQMIMQGFNILKIYQSGGLHWQEPL